MDNHGLKHILTQRYIQQMNEPEIFFINTIKGCEVITSRHNNDKIYYKNDEIIFIEDDEKKILWCSRELVWNVVIGYCGNELETAKTIREIVKKISFWKHLTIWPITRGELNRKI